MFSKYRIMSRKLSELLKLYPRSLAFRRAVECREYARTMRADLAKMTPGTQSFIDRERVAEMYEEKVETLLAVAGR